MYIDTTTDPDDVDDDDDDEIIYVIFILNFKAQKKIKLIYINIH